MRNDKNQSLLTFEASVGYIHNPRAAARIYKYNPNMKLILILRDPVDRAFSQWNMGRNLTKVVLDSELAEYREFREVITYELDLIKSGLKAVKPPLSYIPRGLYLEQIENYLKLFPRHQIFITENKKLKLHRVEVLNEIIDFLELPAFQWNEGKLVERYKADYKDRTMDDDIRKILAEFYHPYNKDLFQFLGETYEWQ